jgi:hypothetical protein
VRHIKIVVENHPDGYVAYPLGIKGVVVGEGDTYEEALNDVCPALAFDAETFGPQALEVDPPVLEAFVAEAGLQLAQVEVAGHERAS